MSFKSPYCMLSNSLCFLSLQLCWPGESCTRGHKWFQPVWEPGKDWHVFVCLSSVCVTVHKVAGTPLFNWDLPRLVRYAWCFRRPSVCDKRMLSRKLDLWEATFTSLVLLSFTRDHFPQVEVWPSVDWFVFGSGKLIVFLHTLIDSLTRFLHQRIFFQTVHQ